MTNARTASEQQTPSAASTRLLTAILSQFSDTASDSNGDQLSIGLEHEFFLLDRDGLPATHEGSQSLFSAVGQLPNWSLVLSEDEHLGIFIESVVYAPNDDPPTTLKYDHHPHLIEVAFRWSKNLLELGEHIREVLASIQNACLKLNLTYVSAPELLLPADHPRLMSHHRSMCQLRAYRAALQPASPGQLSTSDCNYAAVLAATQVHVGGLQWWQRPTTINALYSLEPTVARVAYQQLRIKKEVFRRRWAGYMKVFAGFPLVGFPETETWTLEWWSIALLNSPWAGINQADPRQCVLEPFTEFEDVLLAMQELRDLQIIRPRLSGTVEFRGDPSQPNADSMILLAKSRLDACYRAVEMAENDVDLRLARQKWLRGP